MLHITIVPEKMSAISEVAMAQPLRFDPVQHFGRSLEHFGQTVLELFPTMAVPIVFLILAKRVVQFSEDSVRTAPFEIFFFCILGVVAAYIGQVSKDGFVAHILPAAIGALVVLFQLLGLTVEKLTAPLSTKKVLMAASGSGLSYLVAARYLRISVGGAP